MELGAAERPPAVGGERLARQVDFLLEIDALKNILRQTLLLDRARSENSAEHSWHIALAAMVLRDYADSPEIELERVIRMLLLHDLVEIDAGDTYCYDEAAKTDQHEREKRAAARIFGLLPAEQAARFQALWNEFEERRTPESRFANAMDRFQAFLHNYCTEGQVWRRHGVSKAQVLKRMQPLESGAPPLWDYVRTLIDAAVAKGFLLP
jgi:putative hydrolase of HD superfamily